MYYPRQLSAARSTALPINVPIADASGPAHGNDFLPVTTRDLVIARSPGTVSSRTTLARSLTALQGFRGNAFVQRLIAARGTSKPSRTSHGQEIGVGSRLQCECAQPEPVYDQPSRLSRSAMVQRTIGDSHDLTSPRFKGDDTLEACFDDEARLTMNGLGKPGTRKVDSGPAVLTVQNALIELGFLAPGLADGNYTLPTWNAVKALKKKEGLGFETMGDVGPGTMGFLDRTFETGCSPCPSAGPRPDTCPPCPSPAPSFGDFPAEPGCPDPSGRLGDVAPEPDCPTSSEEITGERFHFCRGSDVFSNPSDAERLRAFARNRPAQSLFTVHAHASREGSDASNRNLACHRAKRVARDLINAGVRSERIQIVNKGATNRFDSGVNEAAFARNRVAVVAAQANPPELDQPLPTSRREIVEAAKAKIDRGEYRLAADAYISFWTCGRVPTLAEAVKRTSILIEGDPGAPPVPVGTSGELGVVHPEGLNSIVLSNQTFGAANVLECVIARIIDMSFHHMVRPQIPEFAAQHQAALFLVELAGFGPCREPDITLLNVVQPGRTFWTPPRTDPQQGQPDPPCASPRLPGPLVSSQGLTGRQIPRFQVDDVTVRGGSGPTIFQINASGNTARMSSPAGAFQASAQVTLIGDASEFSNYEVGFIQTIVETETTIDYVGGHRVRLPLPVPLRDGRPSSQGGRAPWFEPAGLRPVDPASGIARATLSDSPAQAMALNYIDFERSRIEPIVATDSRGQRQLLPPRIITQAGNRLNRANRRIVFNTWLVARRINAPLDRFSTHFLDGTIIGFSQDVDVVGDSGSGAFRAQVDNATDPTPMQLSGPVPADFRPAEQTTFTNPPSRESAGGLDLAAYQDRVRAAAEPLRRDLGLTGRTFVEVRINRTTGRVAFDTPEFRAVTAQGDGVPQDILDTFAERLFFVIRKDLVLAPLQGRLAPLGTVPVAMVPIPGTTPRAFTQLIDRPGIRSTMAQMWRASQADPLNPKEFSLTVFIDRRTQNMTFVSKEGPPESQNRGLQVEICFQGDSLPRHISILGTIHTHPDTTSTGRQEPSPEDLDRIGGNSSKCGVEHYVIADNSIFQFDSVRFFRLGRRSQLIGP